MHESHWCDIKSQKHASSKKKKKKLQHRRKTQDADVYPKKKGRLLPEVAVVIGEGETWRFGHGGPKRTRRTKGKNRKGINETQVSKTRVPHGF